MPTDLNPDLDAYRRFLERRDLSPHTVRAYVGHLARWLRLEPQPTLLVWVEEHLRHSPAGTASQLKAAVRHWLAHLGQPPLDLPRGKRRRRGYVSALSPEELTAFYRRVGGSKLSPAIATILQLLPRTGLRIDECCSLRISDMIVLQGVRGLRVDGKGGKERFVPLTAEACLLIDRYLSDHRTGAALRSPIFPCRSGASAIRPDSVRSALRRVRTSPRLTPHLLRHTFATRAYQAGTDLLALRELLGHTSLDTTSIYVTSSARQLRAGAQAAELDTRDKRTAARAEKARPKKKKRPGARGRSRSR